MSTEQRSIITRALAIKRNLGLRAAAGYLRNRSVPVTVAAYVLAQTEGYVRPRVALPAPKRASFVERLAALVLGPKQFA